MTGHHSTDPLPLLRVPPFPGADITRAKAIGVTASASKMPVTELLERLRETRVGGNYWAAQPALPPKEYILLRPKDRPQYIEILNKIKSHDPSNLFLWLPQHIRHREADSHIPIYQGDADPWHMLSGASALWADRDDETAFIAALSNVYVQLFGTSTRFGFLADMGEQALRHVATRELLHRDWIDPFTDMPCPVEHIIDYCSEWRRLIDSNRPIKVAFGFGHWKQDTVDALLWNGVDGHTPFAPATEHSLAAVPGGASIAVWKARVPESFLNSCEASAHTVYEVEDGFIRSVGLGADCVPPLSIIVDQVGVHYDPSQPSSLENMLADGDFSPELLERARQLRELIVESRISKYDVGEWAALSRPGGELKHILVLGQVEDDRSVLAGGGDVRSNLELLRRARAAEPHAYILYKPHPDVLAGHRPGDIPEAEALKYADEIVGKEPISALLDMVDGVHVITSLAGFEALLRGKAVTTHGTPFYAGWCLTTDLRAIPERRGRARTLDELVAATLLLYPRYLDPVTGLPCPPEILIERLRTGTRRENRFLVMLRRAQGNLRRLIFGLR